MNTITRDDTQHGREYYDAAEVDSVLAVMSVQSSVLLLALRSLFDAIRHDGGTDAQMSALATADDLIGVQA